MVGQPTLRALRGHPRCWNPPLALHPSPTRAQNSHMPQGKALLLSATDHGPRFCQNGKRGSDALWRSSALVYWFFLSSGGMYGGGGGWS